MHSLGLYREEAFGDNEGQAAKLRLTSMERINASRNLSRQSIEAAAPPRRGRRRPRRRRREARRRMRRAAAGVDAGFDRSRPAGLDGAAEYCSNEQCDSWPVGAALPLANVKLLAPIPRPRKNIFGIGLNYVEHVAESSRALDTSKDLPKQPMIFSKPPTSVIGPGRRHRAQQGRSPSNSTGRSNSPS